MRRLLILTLFLSATLSAMAIPTRLMIRAQAKDAKFIGSSIGGAYVKVSEAMGGKILSTGYTSGSTGNTDIIMRQPHARFGKLSNDETAGFLAMLDIEEPVFVTVEVWAPVNQRQAQVYATTQLWMIPGKHIEGDGLIIEIPGMIVNALAPQTHESLTLSALTYGMVEVKANVVLMCGCPITEGGLWNSADVEVKALVYYGGDLQKEVPMPITQKANTFAGRIPVTKAGNYEVVIYAYNAKTGNTGVDKVNFLIQE
jgi:hypothetical protein